MYEYKTRGTCSSRISFDIRDGRVYGVRFENGCNGNGKAIGRLVEGMPVDEVQERLAGVVCAGRRTSCADQFAQAISAAGQGSLQPKD